MGTALRQIKKSNSCKEVKPRKKINFSKFDFLNLVPPGAPNITQEQLDRDDQYFIDHEQEYLEDEYIMDPKTGKPRVFDTVEELFECLLSDKE